MDHPGETYEEQEHYEVQETYEGHEAHFQGQDNFPEGEEEEESPGESGESPQFGEDQVEGETTEQDNDIQTGNGENNGEDAAQAGADGDNVQEKLEDKRWPGWPGDNAFRMLVPVHKVGAVIGHKGDIIKKMSEETKARIRVLNSPPGVQERVVCISV